MVIIEKYIDYHLILIDRNAEAKGNQWIPVSKD